MLPPERRTRGDIAAAVVIVVVVAVAIVGMWAHSDARGTVSEQASHPITQATWPDRLPNTVHELWRAPDAAASEALANSGVAVVADGGTVSGRDPVSGRQVWLYQRNMPLCGVVGQSGGVAATYRDRRGCSQTTLLSADDGARRATRSSFMDQQLTLTNDSAYTIAQGPDRLEVWGSNLVRTLEYGYVDAPVNPHTQPRTGCTLLSSQASTSRLAVLERCPDTVADRLTVLNPAPKDSTVPEEYGSHVLTQPGAMSPGARVLAISDNRIALYLPPSATTAAELAIFDTAANIVASRPLAAPLSDTATITRIGSQYLIFTGTTMMALNTNFDPVWTNPNVLGSPAIMAGQLLLPVPEGFAVCDPSTGSRVGTITTQRIGYRGEPISLAIIGATVVERRGTDLYALGA